MPVYRLITLDPLELCKEDTKGIPLVRRDKVNAPPGHAYVEVKGYPKDSISDKFRWIRKLTPEQYGWILVESVPINEGPSWYVLPTWCICEAAETIKHNSGTLLDAINNIINTLTDIHEKEVALEMFINDRSHDISIDSPIIAKLELTGAQIVELFQKASICGKVD